MKYQGFNFVSYVEGDFGDQDAFNALAEAKQVGSNWIAAVTDDFMRTIHDSTIDPIQWVTESKANLKKTIMDAHAQGLQVMVKPHVDIADGVTSRFEIDPDDPMKWFDEYRDMIVGYAEVARDTGAEMFCVGTELIAMTNFDEHPEYAAKWHEIIDAVRQVYNGPLTYAATWQELNQLTYSKHPVTGEPIDFWGKLDVIGANTYMAVSTTMNPTVADVVEEWTRPTHDGVDEVFKYTGGKPIVDWLHGISQAAKGKPMIFTEVGYLSRDGAGFGDTDGRLVDYAEQKVLFEGLFEVWKQHAGDWMQGMLLWDWLPSKGIGDHNWRADDYTPQGKPVLEIIAREFGGSAEGLILPPGELPNPPMTIDPNTTVKGGAGDDQLFTGTGADLISGGAGSDYIRANHGDDTIVGGDGSDFIFGWGGRDTYVIGDKDGWDMIMDFDPAQDVVEVPFQLNGMSNLISAEDVARAVSDEPGGATLWLGGEHGITFAHVQKDQLTAANFKVTNVPTTVPGKTLTGTAGNDWLEGGAGNDTIAGRAGADGLVGAGGNDILRGEGGDDYLLGGVGADRFVFATGGGNDYVEDFQPLLDTLQIARNLNNSGIDTLTEVLANTSDTADGCSIWLGGNNSVTLAGVHKLDLSAANILFA